MRPAPWRRPRASRSTRSWTSSAPDAPRITTTPPAGSRPMPRRWQPPGRLWNRKVHRSMTTSFMTTDPGAACTNSARSLLATLTGLSRRRSLADATASWCERDFETVLRFWPIRCRPEQRLPGLARKHDPWTTWLMLGGRGAGKTRTGAEWVRGIALGEPDFARSASRRIALIGETFAD